MLTSMILPKINLKLLVIVLCVLAVVGLSYYLGHSSGYAKGEVKATQTLTKVIESRDEEIKILNGQITSRDKALSEAIIQNNKNRDLIISEYTKELEKFKRELSKVKKDKEALQNDEANKEWLDDTVPVGVSDFLRSIRAKSDRSTPH